jgi:hypothetical protein
VLLIAAGALRQLDEDLLRSIRADIDGLAQHSVANQRRGDRVSAGRQG